MSGVSRGARVVRAAQDVALRRRCLRERLAAFRDLLRERGLDGYVLTDYADLVYFTDFQTEGVAAVITQRDAWLLLPPLLYQQARTQTQGFSCLKGRLLPLVQDLVGKGAGGRIGCDGSQVSLDVGRALGRLGIRPVSGLVASLRAVKDGFEIGRLRAANRLAARGAAFLKRRLKAGKTERQLAAELIAFFYREGDGLAFPPIIAAGRNAAFPHHITSGNRLRAGDAVICDIGAMWEGYRSDLTRTHHLGTITPLFFQVHSIVEKAQREAISRLRAGEKAADVDEAARRVIREAGFGRHFVHSTGHGVGIDIHEDPRLGPNIPTPLKAGMVVTVEPGIYVPGRLGVRIEDTLLVTAGAPEILTQ